LALKIHFESLEKIDSFDNRGLRDRPYADKSDITATQYQGHFSKLLAEMELHDPGGKRALARAAKYQK